MARTLRTAAIIATCLAALLAATAVAQARVAPATTVASLLANHKVYSSPGGRAVDSVGDTRPITGEQTALPVLREKMVGSRNWLLVRLPGRPNGHSDWIKAAGTHLWVDYWHIVISTGQRRAWVYYKGHVKRNWLVVVGKPSSPTPTGQFFIEENISEPSNFPGAPYALATSARSNVFTEFDGGPGQVALHGVGGGLGGTPGQAQSHGCVRFTTADISWLAHRVAPGTPVTIT